MRYGTPSRAAHRATADGGLVLLVRGIGSGGQHRLPPAPPLARVPVQRGRRRAAPVRPSVEPQRAVQWLTQGLAGLILLGLVLMIGFLVMASDRRQPGSGSTVAPGAAQSPSLAEIFGEQESFQPVGATGAYRIEMRHYGRDCGEATTGELGALLAGSCLEVARAGLISPYAGYQVTAGMFTLADAGAAATVNGLVREQVVSGSGGFRTLPAATGGDPAAASVGWHVRGNFLLYCVITRSDGALVPDDDPYARRITAEIVDNQIGAALPLP